MEEQNQRDQNKPHNIVIGQRVSEEKVVLARQMRREMTPTEARLWARLRRSRLATHFRRQQIVHGFFADFYCHGAALVLEADGPIHDPSYDAERDRIFAGLGITVLRFTNAQVENQIGVVLYQIRRWLREAATQPRTYPGASADPPEALLG